MSERTIVIEHGRLAIVIDEIDTRHLYQIRAFDFATIADLILYRIHVGAADPIEGVTLDREALALRLPLATQTFETRRELARAVHALFFEEQD